MSLPPLNSEGVLPRSMHDCTLNEMRDMFAHPGSSLQRRRLFEDLERYVNELRKTGIPKALIVNGSFATSKEEPNDIDLIVVLPSDFNFEQQIGPFEYNLISRRRVRRNYGFDVFALAAETQEYQEMVEFFHRTRQPGLNKGLLRVAL